MLERFGLFKVEMLKMGQQQKILKNAHIIFLLSPLREVGGRGEACEYLPKYASSIKGSNLHMKENSFCRAVLRRASFVDRLRECCMVPSPLFAIIGSPEIHYDN